MIVRISVLIALAFSLGCARPTDYLYPDPAPLPQRKVDPGPPGAIHGVVTNAVDGRELPGVSVVVHEGDAQGPVLFTTTTGFDGTYDVQRLSVGTYAVDFNLLNYVPILAAPAVVTSAQTTSLNESMTTVLADGQYRIILNWVDRTEGAVRDVDSYLMVPGYETMPVGYQNRVPNNGANLDHDMTSWRGPETITITDLKPHGIYRYYVNNFNIRCDPYALARSGVTVRLYHGSRLIKTYTLPTNSAGITYEFFEIRDGQVVDVNQWADRLLTYGGSNSCMQ